MSHPRACPQCLRRSWLLPQLAPYIERIHPPATDVARLLRLDDEWLAEAVAPDVAAAILAGVAAIPERRFADELEAASCWAVCRHDDLYPRALADIDGAPPAVIGRGDPIHLAHLDPAGSATVVGSRRATSYGREVARGLGYDLAKAGVTVVSGLAFGVDACAHRGALEGGSTIAVLGCGPDVAYPTGHRQLWRRIGEQGLVLSELPPGAAPWRWTFTARSRILAALGRVTVVVEAAARSGSLITAELAADHGREVGAVPGPVSSRPSQGANALLADGAALIRDAEDVLAAMQLGGPAAGTGRRSIPAAEPAYTVVGVYAEPAPGDHRRFAEVFYTHDGPGAAESLAERWAAEQDGGPEIIIAAVLAGEVEMLDARRS